MKIYLGNSSYKGVTFSGGDPFLQAKALSEFAKIVHENSGDVMVYTGYTLEKLKSILKNDQGIKALLDETDLLVDGPFIIEKRCLDLDFRGSTNQKLIPLSKKGGEILKLINTKTE